jgi:hypothetical protein
LATPDLLGMAERIDAARREVEDVGRVLEDEVGSDLALDAVQAANILRELSSAVRDLNVGGTGPIRPIENR